MTTLSFMLAGSSHAHVRARWIITRPCLLDVHARWIPTHARLCPLDPRTTVPAGFPHTRACWIPTCLCPLDPHACPCLCPPDPHACTCPCPLDPHTCTHAHIHQAHARTPDVHAQPSPHSLARSRCPLARGAPMHSRGVPTLAHATSLARIYASAGCVMYASLSFM